ncbi:GTPase HflX [Sphingomonas lutea]|uniref:GTPase HflX n=1 Tax=Sphingomonas lutea TaxID=1045317 RepID=A0A7G9SL61_9SPHN|nr:GTPase HflX [Sphingomonas lutea]QNN68586.1 GTPase HflX [Sphingomonas lutea]
MNNFDGNGAIEVARGERAILVVPELPRDGARRSVDARLDEAAGLAEAIGIAVVGSRAFRVRTVRPASLLGKGQVEEVADLAREKDAKLLIVDAALTPVQQKTLEDEAKTKVIDRTGLILEIFGERAATAEGRLQVELAHLDYQAGRLVRSWTHLERQRGGFGFLGGPGETQIEADRRMIRDRMARIRRELDQVKRTRSLHRDRRQRAPWPVIALVGYTNAGKSTLFNRLTGEDVFAQDLLFATLDPTMRDIRLPGFDKVILSDTVGFVSDLPTELIAAFRATLEEVRSADLLVHVRDVAHPDSEAQRDDVADVLASLDLAEEGAPPRIEAWNKIDLLTGDERERVLGEAQRRDDVVPISAITGDGLDELRQAMAVRLRSGEEVHQIRLAAGDGGKIAWLHSRGKVLDQRMDEDQVELSVRLSPDNWARFQALESA